MVVKPWPGIAHIWLWWLAAPLLCCFALIAGMIVLMVACMCVANCMGIMPSSANAVPAGELEAGEDSSAPDVEMGALKAAEGDPENDSEKHPDKLATAMS